MNDYLSLLSSDIWHLLGLLLIALLTVRLAFRLILTKATRVALGTGLWSAYLIGIYGATFNTLWLAAKLAQLSAITTVEIQKALALDGTDTFYTLVAVVLAWACLTMLMWIIAQQLYSRALRACISNNTEEQNHARD